VGLEVSIEFLLTLSIPNGMNKPEHLPDMEQFRKYKQREEWPVSDWKQRNNTVKIHDRQDDIQYQQEFTYLYGF
jgi:hypothetical protein